ncbi:TPA: hypothetical protein OOF39_003290 [Kluyvera ascorbata]|uniref:Uncharacterized protein n=1 Tax=Kluyvera genomosp. 3 TaxID=2774055 RepID=A0A248KGK2_9ENTR|nr:MULTISPECIES: hypothetical protein [Kluyvera]ASG62679.1 hypothetical protein CEW81_03235 [Kluyvera genomosp. 3]MDA8489229.1 hypothetical protein [Kluyvera sp. Awk 3]QIR25902.1 hypothetical protein GY169_03380 [Kluyvera genomosp. 3]UAK21859.1 hypothetical protein K7B04_08290 [Kluyvera sp. CRP]HCR3983820.1 hypothetical protein [Kluyvera ascorbata]
MSKRNHKKQQTVKAVVMSQPVSAPKEFGVEEMLSELEAIVAEAENRQAEERAA